MNKKCKICATAFNPIRPLQKVCSPACGIKCAEMEKQAKVEKCKREQRKKDKAKLEEMKSIPQLTREAQKAFNGYIRARDVGKPCISCGAPWRSAYGGLFDAGHYRSTGAAPHLRFEENNCHSQCVRCNRNLSGNVVEYRRGIIERIGLGAVEALEADQRARNYSKDDLREIAKHYRAKAREIGKVKF